MGFLKRVLVYAGGALAIGTIISVFKSFDKVKEEKEEKTNGEDTNA